MILSSPCTETGSVTHPLLFLHQMKYVWDAPKKSEKVHLLKCNEKKQQKQRMPTGVPRVHSEHNVKESVKSEMNVTHTKVKHKLTYFVSIPEETREELSKISNNDLIVNL